MKRILITALAALVAVVALGTGVIAANGSDTSTVTRGRLERTLPATFANLYAQHAQIQGQSDITPASINAQAMCDKAGAAGVDVGPGGDWVCLMSWTDPEVPMPTEGYGKFELNVHSNDCYTASGPSKLTGFLTMTDKQGREVTNPLFEFDGCFDPASASAPTGVVFPSLLSVTSTPLTPDSDDKVGLQVTCGTGDKGCAGTVSVAAGKVALGSIPFDIKEEASATLMSPQAVPTGTKELTFTVQSTTGVGPSSPVTLPVQGGQRASSTITS
ncbi:MAG: hypothetical protein ABIR39_14805 [Nocardioides sp.]|uniref:hypothetical protein n=1 Tax=Nocardioides sp. TaxID=35761 RepID=UPI003262EBDC